MNEDIQIQDQRYTHNIQQQKSTTKALWITAIAAILLVIVTAILGSIRLYPK